MKKSVWRRFLILLPLLIVLVVASRVYIRSVVDTYEIRSLVMHPGVVLTSDDVRLSKEGVVEVVSVSQDEAGSMDVVFHALADGEVNVVAGTPDGYDEWTLRVQDGAIIEGGVNFSGWEAVHVSVCVFLAATVALFASALVRLWREAWYGYEMVACGGGMLFCSFQLALFVFLLLGRVLDRSGGPSRAGLVFGQWRNRRLHARGHLHPVTLVGKGYPSVRTASLYRYDRDPHALREDLRRYAPHEGVEHFAVDVRQDFELAH